MPSSRIAILFALPDEAHSLSASLKKETALASRLHVRVSGVGAENASKAAAEFLNTEMEFSMLIICGFGGGLAPELGPGDLLIADAVEDHTRNGASLRSSPALLERAGALMESGKIESAKIGTLATVSRVLTTPEEKQEFSKKTTALGIDMESAGAARVAMEKSIPWIAVRAITDAADEALPLDFNQYADANGNPDKLKIALAVLKKPSLIPALMQLGKRSNAAAKRLSEFILRFCLDFPA